MVINQGNFHLVGNDLKFTILWELAHLPKPTYPHLKQFVDFIVSRSFFICKNPNSWQKFRSITVLHGDFAS